MRGISLSCFGKINAFYDLKFRYYNEITNTYSETRFDRGEVKPKGLYRKKIYCKDNNKIYNTQQECANDLGIRQTQVSEKLRLNKDCGFDLSYFEEKA